MAEGTRVVSLHCWMRSIRILLCWKKWKRARLEDADDALKDAISRRVVRGCVVLGEVQKLNIAVLSRVPLAGLRGGFRSSRGGGPTRGMLSFFVELGQGRRLLSTGCT